MHLIPIAVALATTAQEGALPELELDVPLSVHSLHEAHLVFMRLVHKQPSRLKTARLPGGAGGRLKDEDIAVSIHPCCATDGEPMIMADGVTSQGNSIFILRDLHRIEHNKLKAATLWEVNLKCLHLGRATPGMQREDLEREHRLLQSVLGELEDDTIPALAHGLPLLLADKGLSADLMSLEHNNQVQLTLSGRKLLSLLFGVTQLSTLLATRQEMRLLDLCLHELIMLSVSAGWEWKCLPARRSEKRLLVYKAGEPKIAYFSPTCPPHKLYVICLLRSADLCSDGRGLPHWTATPAKA